MSRASNLQNAIMDYLTLRGHVPHRNHTTGIYDPRRKTFRTLPKHSRGVGDILCVVRGGRWLEIEVKVGNDEMSNDQIERKRKVVRAGGMYWEVKTFDEFLKLYRELLKTQRACAMT